MEAESFSCGSDSNSKKINITGGNLQYLYDEKNTEILDCVNGLVQHVGHCHPQVASKAKNQYSRLTTAQAFVSDVLSKYVRDLVQTLPEKLSVCYLCNSGDEANDLALKLSREYTEHLDVLVHEDAYYGHLRSLKAASPRLGKEQKVMELFTGKTHMLHPPNYNSDEENTKGENFISQVEKQLQDMKSRDIKLAAYMLEPYFVLSGLYIPPEGYFSKVYNHIHQMGGLCIVDESKIGLGRTGEHFWGFQNLDATPDIIAIGESLGNGHPMGAVICTKEISEKFPGYFTTFGGNPVSCNIGSAVLDIIHHEKLLQSAKSVGKLVEQGLSQIKAQYPNIIRDVRGQGLIWAIEMASLSYKTSKELSSTIMEKLMQNNILVSVSGQFENVILFTPPMCFCVQNCRSFCSSLKSVLREVENESKQSAD